MGISKYAMLELRKMVRDGYLGMSVCLFLKIKRKVEYFILPDKIQ